ncbi:hypothetical protein [Geminisphaera colitermitum]|uniref:hypothetical protein n=1 Tax=Geminisphaera colitermitum TaxID=1148786 RepID=UPI00030F4488|nr:hypothetical protein [Geminisphaera colitermitum]
MKTSFRTLAALLSSAIGMSILVHAQTASANSTTWTYSFSGAAADGLNGLSTGLADDGRAALTWTASTNFKADGHTTGAGSAWLGYDFQDGFVYTLKVDVDSTGLTQAATSGNFGAIGFTTDKTSVTGFGSSSPHHGLLVLRTKRSDNNTLPQHTFYSTPSTGNYDKTRSLTVSTSTATLTFVLDTTGPAWGYTVSIGSTSISSSEIYTFEKATLNGFGLVANASGAKFSNLRFTATQVIPEPAAATLLIAIVSLLPLALWRVRVTRG